MAPGSTSFDGTDGSPTVDAAFDSMRALVADLRDQARKETERADSAEMLLLSTEREVAKARQAIEDARQEANSIIEGAKREAEAITAEANRVSATAREAEIVDAMRSYLQEIEESQATLLRIARRALSALAALGPTSDPRKFTFQPDHIAERSVSASEAANQSGQTEGAPPNTSASDPITPPVTRGRRTKTPHREPENRVVFAGSTRSPDLTTDEHRLIDLSNQRDLDRLDAPLSVKNLLRGL